jgi:anti-anti-sigma factor
MAGDFKLTTERPEGKPHIAVLRVGGWLDGQTEAQLVDAVQKARDAGAKYVLIDLSDLNTLTSAGIRAMQKAYQILTPKEEAYKTAYLKLCNAPPQIYQVLNITGFLHNVPVYESREDAIESFGD